MVISYILNKGAELVGKKWRAVIIWHLQFGPLRFSELKRHMPQVSVKVLSEVLQEMETNQLVVRVQYATIPVRVTYELHPEAMEFSEANIVCTIKIGEYLVKHSKRMEIPTETVDLITEFLTDHRNQATDQ